MYLKLNVQQKYKKKGIKKKTKLNKLYDYN